MKFYSVAIVAMLFCAVYGAQKSPEEEANSLRKFVTCVDGILSKLAAEHTELEKYYSGFKALANKTNLQLDECLKMENGDAKEE